MLVQIESSPFEFLAMLRSAFFAVSVKAFVGKFGRSVSVQFSLGKMTLLQVGLELGATLKAAMILPALMYFPFLDIVRCLLGLLYVF